MSIGAQSPFWRRWLFRSLDAVYFRRAGRTEDGRFEAYVSPGSSLRLRRNAGLRVSVVCAALGRADGVADFQVSAYSRAMSKLAAEGRWHDAQVVAAEVRRVPTLRIDTLARDIGPPDVLKIDVEGAEASVLEGGADTIARHRPVILIEGPRELAVTLREFFVRHRYVLMDGGQEPPVAVESPVWDTVAVPEERQPRAR